jgi:hypothetical protein
MEELCPNSYYSNGENFRVKAFLKKKIIFLIAIFYGEQFKKKNWHSFLLCKVERPTGGERG